MMLEEIIIKISNSKMLDKWEKLKNNDQDLVNKMKVKKIPQ